MSDRPRYYLTTAIAYANNKPGLHTLYEVIGADVIARWHRMMGDDTRFLTGTDEHSINIAQAAVDEGRPDPRVRRREGRPVPDGRGRPRDRAGPVHPDDRPRPRPGGPGDGPPRLRERRHLPRHLRGLVLPERGLPQRDRRRSRPPAGTICPNHPDVPLQWLTERNWFFRLSAYQERLERHFAEHPDFVQPDFRRNEMLGLHPRRARGLLDQPRADARRLGHPVPDRRERRVGAARGRLVGPGGRQRSTSGTTRSSTTSRAPASRTTRRRSTAGGRPTSTSSARTSPGSTRSSGRRCSWSAGPRAAAPGLGPRLAAGRRRRADEQEPRQLPRPRRLRGRVRPGRRALRRPARGRRSTATPRCRGTRSSAATTPTSPTTSATSSTARSSMANRYLDGERPAPRRRGELAARRPGPTILARVRATRLEGCLLHEALAALWEFVGGANKIVDARAAVGPGQGREGGRRGRRRRGSATSSAISSRPAAGRARGRPVHARDRRRACSAQLGYEYPYGARRQRRPADPRGAGLGRATRGRRAA